MFKGYPKRRGGVANRNKMCINRQIINTPTQNCVCFKIILLRSKVTAVKRGRFRPKI